MDFRDFLKLMEEGQRVELVIEEAGTMRSVPCILESALNARLLDAEVVGVAASNDRLRVWVKDDVCREATHLIV